MGRLHGKRRTTIATPYSTVHKFIRCSSTYFGSVEADASAMEALKQLPHLIDRKKLPATEVAQEP
ncbi:hypothetical protein ACIQM4_11590 [Streptomyces sp. NPDC091272]|uniref:hypothetical protein n=1 Tax=Streptomyces sp. NPDC091272 TaxID=3365981 RepID=UPI0037FDC0BC